MRSTRAIGSVSARRPTRWAWSISTAALAARRGAPIIVVHRAEFQALFADALGRERIHTGARLRAHDPDVAQP